MEEHELAAEIREWRKQLDRLVQSMSHLTGIPQVDLPFTLPQLLKILTKHKGTFLHLNVGCPPMLRIAEELVPVGDHILEPDDCRYLIKSILTPEQIRLQSQGHELDFNRVEGEDGFRFHVYLERGCPAASVRRLRTDIPKLVELGLSGGAVEQFLSADNGGLMILSGKPRSGKINTFASLVDYINHQRRARIVTIEPLIQFWHQSLESAVIQREVGSDSRSFAQAVRQAVQQDPDILAVGSIPDLDTAEVLIQAAAGGHLVVALIDAPGCVRAVDEMITGFSGSDKRMQQLLARVTRLVVCQHLVGRADGRGLIPAMEILECNEQVSQMIAQGECGALHQLMRDSGMQTLGRHLSRMVEVGLVTAEEAGRFVGEGELEVAPRTHLEVKPAAAMDADTPLMSWL